MNSSSLRFLLRASLAALTLVVGVWLAPLSAAADTAPTFTSGTTITFPEGYFSTFTVTTTGSPTSRITQSGHLPGGVKFFDNGDGTATLSGRPGNGLGLTGNYALTFTATNGVNPPATQSFVLIITRPAVITSVNNAAFVVGVVNSFTVATRNSVPKATLSLSGALPSGVTFVPHNNGTATLSGNPAAGSEGIYSLTISATNGMPPTAVQKFTLRVQDTAPPQVAPTITTAASASFTVGTEGIFTVQTNGTPTASLNATGTLPSWLSFIDNTDGTASLVGIPDSGTPSSYSFTISASNGVAPDAMQTFTVSVVTPPPDFTSVNNTTFVVGTDSSFGIRTMPLAPAAMMTFAGTLPTGVSLVSNGDGTGTLSGNPAAGTEGTYQLTMTASNGTLPNATQIFTLTVQDSPPVTQAPTISSASNTTFVAGAAGSFTITTSGVPTSRITLTGPQPGWLRFVDNNNGTATLSGTPDTNGLASYTFTITATNGVSPAASQTFTLTVPLATTPTKPTNISTRLSIMTGGNIGIGGFIIAGSDPKKVIIRCLGPTLTQFKVAGALQNPRLELHNSSGGIITSNEDWKDSQEAAILASGYAPPDSREPAILITLQPDSYTIFASGSNNTTGVGLVEVYDLDPAANSKLRNLSTRGSVQTAANVMIGGFILGGGADPETVVIRALGPTLTSFGVRQALADPTLALYDANGELVAANDNWKQTQETQIKNTGLQPPNDLEAAILVTLPASRYTAIVKGKNGGTGVGLVEVYTVP